MATSASTPAFSLDFLAPQRRTAFVALLANRLADQITEDSADALRARGFRTPAICVSMVMHLHDHGPASLTDLSRAYGAQHQLVTLRVTKLEQRQLVRRTPDPSDQRRRLIQLTTAGRREAEKLSIYLDELAAAVADLQEEVGIDLVDLLHRVLASLQRHPLSQRMAPARKAR